LVRLLAIAFILLPIVEIALFIKVGGTIGVLPTIALVLLAAFAGLAIIRRQGLQTLDRLRQSLDAGGDPAGPLAHGALVAVAGVLLFLPGFLTDAVGLLLLLPPMRHYLIRRGAARTTVHVSAFARRGRAQGRAGPHPHRPETIDADYEIVEDGSGGPRPQGNSGWTRPHS
jgi:UPF0716 protein FxsA